MRFPEGFAWGAATAAYQIEGAADEGGRGPSVWDAFCRNPGVRNGDAGDVACDHYRRYREDVALMADMGLNAYRFSVSWSRVLPEGVGRANEEGLDFYDRLTDALLERGIEPWVTLFHWDYPLALQKLGGWSAAESPDWFAEYAAVVVDRLSDRVWHWFTLNEPQCFVEFGHRTARHAPGLKLPFPETLRVAHRVLLAHGKAVRVIRDRAAKPPRIGAAPVGVIAFPASDAPEDVAAARQATFAVPERDFWNSSWFSDPMWLGRYPEDGLRRFGDAMPEISDDDMETIAQPLDFFAFNNYFAQRVRAGVDGAPEPVPAPVGAPHTAFDWEITPEGLYWGARFFHERYGRPIVVAENGMANCDWVGTDGRVRDPQRIDFLTRYLRELRRAVGDGVPVEGYFLWSLLDNFEWAEGYSKRFGLVHVDYASGRRTPKDSAAWYRRVIETHGAALDDFAGGN